MNRIDLEGQVAVVTGGAQGLGLAIASRLLASGALDLAPERVRSFSLDAVHEAVAHAAAHPGPFDRTALTPSAA